ncbi:MAG: acetylxylan esterase [Anaerolineae bacterium]
MPEQAGRIPTIDARYTSHRHGGQPFVFDAPMSVTAWERRADYLREHMRVVLGLDEGDPDCPLDAHLSACGEGDGYVVERVWFQSRPGFLCTGNLFRPSNPVGRIPAILNPHGHWERGRLEDGPRGSVRARCIAFARMGMAALAYDMVGYNDSLQVCQHRYASMRAALWGLSSMALQTQNSLRAVDFLLSLPYVDPARIGCTGASGGGTQTFMLGALDRRVAVLAPVNMVSAHFQGGCTCENAPGLRTDTHNVEIAALAAPRPLLLVSATGDWTINTPRVEYPAIRRVYELYGAEEHVQCVQQDAPHNYNAASRAHVYRWFARWFLGSEEAAANAERPYADHADDTVRVFPRGDLPKGYHAGARGMRDLVQVARQRSAKLLPLSSDSAIKLARETRRRSAHILSISPLEPDEVSMASVDADGPANGSGQHVVLSMTSRGTRVEGRLWLPPGGEPSLAAVMLHPAGLPGLLDVAGLPADWLDAALGEDRAVLAISPLGTNPPPPEALARRDGDWFWATFNPPIIGEQVLDVLTAISALGARWPGTSLAVIGLDGAGAWALMASALDERVKATYADVGSWAWDDEDAYLGDGFAPCLARYGLLPAIAASLAPRPLALRVRDTHNGRAWVDRAYEQLGAPRDLRVLSSPTPMEMGRFLQSVENGLAAHGD